MSTKLTPAHKKILKNQWCQNFQSFHSFCLTWSQVYPGHLSIQSLVSESLLVKTLHSKRDFWDHFMMSHRIVFCISRVPQTLLWTFLCLILSLSLQESLENMFTHVEFPRNGSGIKELKKIPCSWKEYFLGNSHFSYLYVAYDIIVIFASDTFQMKIIHLICCVAVCSSM